MGLETRPSRTRAFKCSCEIIIQHIQEDPERSRRICSHRSRRRKTLRDREDGAVTIPRRCFRPHHQAPTPPSPDIPSFPLPLPLSPKSSQSSPSTSDLMTDVLELESTAEVGEVGDLLIDIGGKGRRCRRHVGTPPGIGDRPLGRTRAVVLGNRTSVPDVSVCATTGCTECRAACRATTGCTDPPHRPAPDFRNTPYSLEGCRLRCNCDREEWE